MVQVMIKVKVKFKVNVKVKAKFRLKVNIEIKVKVLFMIKRRPKIRGQIQKEMSRLRQGIWQDQRIGLGSYFC